MKARVFLKLYTNSNIQNSIMVLTFSALDWKYGFWTNLFQKIKIVSLSRNLVPRLKYADFNRNMQISIMIFTFSIFEHKYPSWTNFVQKFKIVCSK